MTDEYINKILSFTRRFLLLIPMYMIFYSFDFLSDINIIKILILVLLSAIPFFTEIIENKNIHLKRLGAILLLIFLVQRLEY